MANETDAAYLAGLVDGDGCITIRRRDRERSKSDRQRGVSFGLRVSIGGESEHLSALRATWGDIGSVWIRKRDGQRHLAEWNLVSKQARRLLESIEPYLILKKQQAQLALSMPRPITRWGVTPELRHRQEEFRVAVSTLNKRFGRGKVVEYGS